MLTFLDACVLIAAAQGTDEVSERAFAIIGDPNREFVVSDYLTLEVLPKPSFNGYREQIDFFTGFFENALVNVETSKKITAQAISMACQYDLSPLDALHVSVACESSAEEFVTAEKPGKPLLRVTDLKIISIYSS